MKKEGFALSLHHEMPLIKGQPTDGNEIAMHVLQRWKGLAAEKKGFGSGEDRRGLWEICSPYHQRSLVETAMFRVKKMFGERLKARSMGAQQSEAMCKCLIINKINQIGLPKGNWEMGSG